MMGPGGGMGLGMGGYGGSVGRGYGTGGTYEDDYRRGGGGGGGTVHLSFARRVDASVDAAASFASHSPLHVASSCLKS